MVWRALRHPNVLQLLGVTVTENRFVMVSEWMVRGNINEFVEADANPDRLGLVRFHMGPLFRPITNNRVITVAWGRH